MRCKPADFPEFLGATITRADLGLGFDAAIASWVKYPKRSMGGSSKLEALALPRSALILTVVGYAEDAAGAYRGHGMLKHRFNTGEGESEKRDTHHDRAEVEQRGKNSKEKDG